MAFEIERKFLVDPSKLPRLEYSHYLTQGYISRSPVVRIRVQGQDLDAPERAWLTIKGKGKVIRPEYEFEVDRREGAALLKEMAKETLSKIRHQVTVTDSMDPMRFHVWEVDEFLGNLKGFWMAEVELKHPDEVFTLPPWARKEVTEDSRYSNTWLAEHGIPKERV